MSSTLTPHCLRLQINYNGQTQTFTPTQILAMFLTKIKETIQLKNPSVTTADVVLSVPAYFTDAQRAAYRDAAAIAGLNCLRVMNDGTAAALSYGIYKSAKKEFDEGRETKVLFLDMGYGHFTATIAGFTNTSLRIVASESDDGVGGRELDVAIAKFLAAEFQAKTGIDAWSDRKARLKLLVAAEKAKITITPFGVNSTKVSIECLKDDRDLLDVVFTLEKLEELAAPFMARVQDCVRRALACACVTPADLLAVELVGGGMRPRVVKRKVAEALGFAVNEETGHGLSTSMNLDECISRGCSLACAMLSPVFRVKPFDIVDRVPYGIRVAWDAPSAAESSAAAAASGDAMDLEDEKEGGASSASASADASGANHRVIFAAGDATPFTRRITFRRSQPFDVCQEYEPSAPIYPGHPRSLGRFNIAIPTDAVDASAPAPKIRVDFRHDMDGTVSIVKAELLKEIKEPAPAAAEGGDKMDVSAEAAPVEGSGKAGPKRYKRVEVPVIPVAGCHGMHKDAIAAASALEKQMAAQDADIHATQDTRNTLETYIYNTRAGADGELAEFGTEEEKGTLVATCSDAESWLYDNMEADRATFQAKLDELKRHGDKLYSRKFEQEHRGAAGDTLLASIEEFRSIMNNRDGKHSHLSDDDRAIIRTSCDDASAWYFNMKEQQATVESFKEPVLRIAEIGAMKDNLVKQLRPIANKRVPAPAPAPTPAPAPAPEAAPPADATPTAEEPTA